MGMKTKKKKLKEEAKIMKSTTINKNENKSGINGNR